MIWPDRHAATNNKKENYIQLEEKDWQITNKSQEKQSKYKILNVKIKIVARRVEVQKGIKKYQKSSLQEKYSKILNTRLSSHIKVQKVTESN